MSFDPIHLWNQMTPIAKGVVVLLIIMSIYSLTVAFERFLYYRKARNQSVAYAKMVTTFLKQDKLQEAIDASKKYKNSHVARVLSAGLYEFSHDLKSRGLGHQGPRHDRGRRARDRARGPGHDRRHEEGPLGPGDDRHHGPLHRPLRNGHRHHQRVPRHGDDGSGGIAAVSAGIAEALVTTALGLFVAIPAVWMFNIFMNNIERFQVEMSNSSNELIDYFIKRRGAGAQLSA